MWSMYIPAIRSICWRKSEILFTYLRLIRRLLAPNESSESLRRKPLNRSSLIQASTFIPPKMWMPKGRRWCIFSGKPAKVLFTIFVKMRKTLLTTSTILSAADWKQNFLRQNQPKASASFWRKNNNVRSNCPMAINWLTSKTILSGSGWLNLKWIKMSSSRGSPTKVNTSCYLIASLPGVMQLRKNIFLKILTIRWVTFWQKPKFPSIL